MADPGNSAGFRLARRRLLGVVGVAAVAGPALAEEKPGPPSHPKGPKVFLDYDQVELNAAYDQDAYAANRPQLIQRYASTSDLVRARLGPPRRVAYGPSEIEKLDIYRAAGAKAPIMVFIHGGAWRTGLAKNYAFPAELFVAAGAHFVVPDFAAVGEVGGSLMVMAEQVRRAIAWAHRNAASFGGDGERLHLAGHSSGAHLAGVALITDWQKDFSVPDDLVKTALLVSGMYDLKGPRLSARSSYVNSTMPARRRSAPSVIWASCARRSWSPMPASTRRSSSGKAATSPPRSSRWASRSSSSAAITTIISS